VNNNNYKQLRKEWYKKLKDEGFNDIEKLDGDLIEWHTSRFTKATNRRYSIEAKSDYYYLANQFLNTYKFKNELFRAIWEYHANGISQRDIVKLLNQLNLTEKGRGFVEYVLKKHKEIMFGMYVNG
jgi:hypothetical protein